jgi:5-phospho-D-xylono-1,4-lactonase
MMATNTTNPVWMTVLGPRSITAKACIDAHAHCWIAPVPGVTAGAPHLDDETAIGKDLSDARRAGLTGLVDCQPGGAGRDGNVLARLAATSGLHIIAATGFHRRQYYPANYWLFNASEDQAADYFYQEITQGFEENRHQVNPVQAGFIKIACETTLLATPAALLAAAAQAACRSGAAIEIHTEKGAAVEDIVKFFNDHGVPSTRLVLCHVDKRPDFGLHQELAQAGALLEYDTFFRPKYQPETLLWPLLTRMVSSGLDKQVALATDLAESSQWVRAQSGGEPGQGPGPAALPRIILPRLRALDFDSAAIRHLTGENIATRLAISARSFNDGVSNE